LSRAFAIPMPRPKRPGSHTPACFSIGDWGDILIGGLVSGRVALNGNAGTFYAGSVWTGDGLGRRQNSDFSDVAGNFYVGGDLNNLVTIDSLGTDNIESGP